MYDLELRSLRPNRFALREFWGFGSVNDASASDCAIMCFSFFFLRAPRKSRKTIKNKEQLIMKEFPESEIQTKNSADAGEKTQRKFGENFCRFSPFNFQEKWLQEISRKILHIFHEGRNKILSPRDSGKGLPQQLNTLKTMETPWLEAPRSENDSRESEWNKSHFSLCSWGCKEEAFLWPPRAFRGAFQENDTCFPLFCCVYDLWTIYRSGH